MSVAQTEFVAQPAPFEGAGADHGLRTGAQYLASLRDDRQVFIDGERVHDVTSHPGLRGAARSMAGLWDIAADPANRDLMTFASPATGKPVLRCYQVPRTPSDLTVKRRMFERWAEATFGLMGRTPDQLAGILTGFSVKPGVFGAAGAQFAENVVRFHEFARDNHLYVASAFSPPQIDRSKPAHQQTDPTLYAGVVGERDGGVMIKGAQQLATGSAIADYVLFGNIHPLQPGDEAYACSVVIPVNAPGVKIYCRRSYAAAVKNAADYPLSIRFDEMDSLIVFDDVFVPWEHVFVYRNIETLRDQYQKTPGLRYGNHQAQVRYATKLRFLLGLTKRVCEITGVDAIPGAQSQLGEMAALASIVELLITAQETQATVDADGVVWPSAAALYASSSLQAEINPRLVDMARELSGGSMVMLPSSLKDFETPEMAADLEKYLVSPGIGARERVTLLKMAWDMIGSEFAGRQHQYEMFYGGAPHVMKQAMYRTYDFAAAKRLVDAALRLPAVD